MLLSMQLKQIFCVRNHWQEITKTSFWGCQCSPFPEVTDFNLLGKEKVTFMMVFKNDSPGFPGGPVVKDPSTLQCRTRWLHP